LKILLTSTSFLDTPGVHQDKLYSAGLEIDTLRGPVKDEILLPIIAQYDGIICGDDEMTRAVIKTGVEGSLKTISKYGVGLDKIDLDAVEEFGIPLTNCPGVNQVSVAEHVLALLFSHYKNIHLEHNITKKGGWKRHVGNEISGKTIGVLGLGKVGKEVALRAKALGLAVLACDPFMDYDFLKTHNIDSVETLEELVSDIDILTLHLPLTESSEGLINSRIISLAKHKLVIVNTARALIVDQDSLIHSLRNDTIRAYLTDVLEEEPMIENHPLNAFENVIITPHIGSRTHESVQRQGMMSVDNLFNSLNIPHE
jgi:D-3-phosphoglycerate dehydrogenase / 2-oxoglutarate reductase